MNDLRDCGAFVSHLRQEHRRLHADILRIQHQWAANAADEGKQPVAALKELRRELVQHFAEEEEGGCLEEAISRCPSLGPEADRIEREHPALLAELDAILAAAADKRSGQSPPQLHQRFKELVRRLHSHEAAENRLLEQAFGEQVE